MGREGERERNIDVASYTPPTGVLAHNPSWELNQPMYVPQPAPEQATFWCSVRCSIH